MPQRLGVEAPPPDLQQIAHIFDTSAGVGVMLMVRRFSILLQRSLPPRQTMAGLLPGQGASVGP